ncbi:hypothetical protein BKA62DRAFT_717600 [Auriculariales sp. MPI-PUGE-AT-0066]|nr:hypothetical protein BKA62DRAFT_717600 [Auriculariales sp. MPI-PUGE-AT-0066]
MSRRRRIGWRDRVKTTTIRSTMLPADSSVVRAKDEPNPGAVWCAFTAVFSPYLVENIFQVSLSTSGYLYPFLHIPSFPADWSSPVLRFSPGCALFVLAICCLASRHVERGLNRASFAFSMFAYTLEATDEGMERELACFTCTIAPSNTMSRARRVALLITTGLMSNCGCSQ